MTYRPYKFRTIIWDKVREKIIFPIRRREIVDGEVGILVETEMSKIRNFNDNLIARELMKKITKM